MDGELMNRATFEGEKSPLPDWTRFKDRRLRAARTPFKEEIISTEYNGKNVV
jgi:hypothetical protein